MVRNVQQLLKDQRRDMGKLSRTLSADMRRLQKALTEEPASSRTRGTTARAKGGTARAKGTKTRAKGGSTRGKGTKTRAKGTKTRAKGATARG
jgi:hypothetical protein